jgi:hypothetical protein
VTGWLLPMVLRQIKPVANSGANGSERRTGVVTLSEIGPIWTINQQAKSLKSLASTLAIVGKFRSV